MTSYRTLRFPTILLLAVGVPCALLGQTKGSGGSNTGGSRGTISSPSTAPRPSLTPTVILTGNVIVANGRQITEPAYIERVCNGRVFRDGRTDSKGFFTITIGPYAPRLSAEGSAEISGLASVALRESKWQEAATWSSRATEMDGVDFPAAFYYNALANYRLGNMDQAEKSARKAEALGAQNSFPQVSLLLGTVLVNRGDYAAAADQLRLYLKAAPTAPNADAVRQQLANVESAGAAESKAQAAPTAK